MQPLAIDLFCGAGGATKGLQRAGFRVIGIDIRPQPRYCGDAFIQGDATNPPVDLAAFDFIWASPPCQAHSSMKVMPNARKHADLIPATRNVLDRFRGPWVIENVMGAPLEIGAAPLFTDASGVILCGSMFELHNSTHELRETSTLPPVNHRSQRTSGRRVALPTRKPVQRAISRATHNWTGTRWELKSEYRTG